MYPDGHAVFTVSSGGHVSSTGGHCSASGNSMGIGAAEPFTVAAAAATKSSLCDMTPYRHSSAVGCSVGTGIPSAAATLQASTSDAPVPCGCSTGPSHVAPSLLGPDTVRLSLPCSFRGAVQRIGRLGGDVSAGGFLTVREISARAFLSQLPHSSTHSEEQCVHSVLVLCPHICVDTELLLPLAAGLFKRSCHGSTCVVTSMSVKALQTHSQSCSNYHMHS